MKDPVKRIIFVFVANLILIIVAIESRRINTTL